MKTIKYAVAAIVLSTLSFGAFAAQEVTATNPQHGEKIGVVSASGAYTLSELESELASKADAAGAKSFKITSASGYNMLSGTAVIYN
ncbi:multiple stress resistance protein BhsA [Entomohabitans teleogrylli]|uniref:multiple stress resistance protein BhsA n=1 Tax=Entomohabitans teleogrylli TaxID=1384589 RepID=UPI00073D6B4E|nr:DUF1471 family protein YbiJ [Entomohabitans teleogrylli]